MTVWIYLSSWLSAFSYQIKLIGKWQLDLLMEEMFKGGVTVVMDLIRGPYKKRKAGLFTALFRRASYPACSAVSCHFHLKGDVHDTAVLFEDRHDLCLSDFFILPWGLEKKEEGKWIHAKSPFE